MCYAELSTYITTSGSAYAYVYTCLGEFPAVIAAACLTLEYLVSAAAVARSWGDKMLEWMKMELGAGDWVDDVFAPNGHDDETGIHGFNPLAGILSVLTVWLLMLGVKESKVVTNVVTTGKVFVVLFMTVGGFCLYKSENLTPYVPPSVDGQFGWSGVLRGATSSFFGYLGDPQREKACFERSAENERLRTRYSRASERRYSFASCVICSWIAGISCPKCIVSGLERYERHTRAFTRSLIAQIPDSSQHKRFVSSYLTTTVCPPTHSFLPLQATTRSVASQGRL